MSLTGNFILRNDKAKPRKYDACCSETTSVRNRDVKQSLRRLVSVPDRSHRGLKVTFSPVQRSSPRTVHNVSRKRAYMGLWGKHKLYPSCRVTFSPVRVPDLQHSQQIPPDMSLF